MKKENNSNESKIFHILACIYLASVLTAIIQASHLMTAKLPLIDKYIIFSGGTLIIPVAFFIQNITSEIYGYTKSRHLVQVGLVISFFSIFYQYFLTFLPVSHYMDTVQNGYKAVFTAIPIHIVAFIVAAFFGNLLNDFIISKTKVYFYGKYLPLRFIAATAVGEAFYILISVVVWSSYLDLKTQALFLLMSYIYRLVFEGATLPISYYFVQVIKRYENIDVYDTNIKYNPFLLRMTDKK